MLLSNYDPETHRGIARAARDLGWHLNISMLNSFQTPEHWRGDGIVCSLDSNRKLERLVVDSGLPCVDLSGWRSDLDIPRVCGDNRVIGELAVEHFCSFGHRAFGWFCHQQNPVAIERFKSFRKELTRRGKAAPSPLIGRRTQDTAEIKKWLEKLERPAALFAYNDNDAAWLLSGCIELGYRVPQDFSILGVDNNRLICEHQPVPLSSVNHDHERVGFQGSLMLDAIMSGKATENLFIRPSGVTLRASSDMLATTDYVVREVLNMMQEQLHKPIGAPELAVAFGVSRRNMEMRFKQALGASIHNKLIELRLERARALLVSSDSPIEDIAARTGFCNSPHLCRSFKKEYGLPPSAYRKAARQV